MRGWGEERGLTEHRGLPAWGCPRLDSASSSEDSGSPYSHTLEGSGETSASALVHPPPPQPGAFQVPYPPTVLFMKPSTGKCSVLFYRTRIEPGRVFSQGIEREATHLTPKEIKEQRGQYPEVMQPVDEEARFSCQSKDLEAYLVSR